MPATYSDVIMHDDKLPENIMLVKGVNEQVCRPSSGFVIPCIIVGDDGAACNVISMSAIYDDVTTNCNKCLLIAIYPFVHKYFCFSR